MNVGCPSDRVQSGRFGACLMAEPALVAECLAAMRAAVSVPVTVKCRIGIDDQDPEDALPRFIETVAGAGVTTIIIHARKAWLAGLSPKENREIPPLDPALVHEMKRVFPHLTIVLNGGVADLAEARAHLAFVDGVMLGRAAYQHPAMLLDTDAEIFGEPVPSLTRAEAVRAMLAYIEHECISGTPLSAITRHMLGLYQGVPRAKQWRRMLTEDARRPGAGPETVLAALSLVDEAEPPERGPRRLWPRLSHQARLAVRGHHQPDDLMHMDYSFATLWPFALGLVFSGVCAGVLAGLLGVGGGIVIVPVLYHVFTALGIDESVRMHLAVATSLAVIIPTSIRSLRAHAKRKAVDFDLLKRWAPTVFICTLIGSVLAGFASGKELTAIFATAALVVAAWLAFGKDEWRIAPSLPKGGGSVVLAGSIGGLSALMGIGGGTFAVPAMTLFGYPIHRAVATSSGLGLIISVPGTIGYIISGWGHAHLPPLSLGYVNLLGFALITPTTVLTAPWGVALAHALPRKRLIQAFALFLALTSIRMFWGLIKG